MTAPMIAGQILHFKGGGRRFRDERSPSSSIRHPGAEGVRAQLFQGLTFYVKIGTLGQ
jgi:hypothetical protein